MSFHPVIDRWFATTLGSPTPAQQRGWQAIAKGRHTLIAAPTGSGKTLAAFLTALDDLFKEGLDKDGLDAGRLPHEVRVVYVSPLKALSADIHKNLAEPRRGIRRIAEAEGLAAPRITAAVRTGDTTQAERAAMLRKPPHILVTTPESLYLLLTSEGGRAMLRTARTVVVDEIHAVIGTRRGAHLALSLERLQHVAERPLLRIGLSATQKPIDATARYLVGSTGEQCAIVDEGHRRRLDLSVELPGSALEAVMSHEVWAEYYDRLAALIAAHRTTLVFVNTRRLAERLARHLSDRVGETAVTAHHGSLSKETRLDAEGRLKSGQLKALVATASLELGIDIGHVDLVCQIGSPHRIATLLQRVGRSGHSISGTPKGRLFPMSRDDLVECATLLRAVARGDLDAAVAHDAPLDVLTQQIVAESSCRECSEDDLFGLVRRAWPYRALQRADFDAVVMMAAEGFATRKGRRAALVHRDEVNGKLRGRKGARLIALTSGGAIPEVADYRVVLDPEETFIGTVNEDFAIESMAGDVFQLGNASWRVLQVTGGTVRVADARGALPNIPFWLGEAPARSDELSSAVSELRRELGGQIPVFRSAADTGHFSENRDLTAAVDWLIAETGLTRAAAEQVVDYISDGKRALGVIPTQQTLVLERFFDESGGMQLVLHAPFGSRINKAWGLALRKRFCRQFNFELQAAATEDALLLSLGPQHSFPLADVFRYLHPETTRDVLVQAMLDAPVFQTRWRWNTTVSLAVPRNRGGKKVPPQLQRMLADDLMAAVFPDAAACLENIPGDREIPDHPLVNQTVRDCLHEAMDFDGLTTVLTRIHGGDVTCVARDTPEPSAFAHEILSARPYAFLDDAPLEERRTQAVLTRRSGEMPGDLGALDAAAIARVRDEERPDARDADELHDALLTGGFLTDEEVAAIPLPFVEALQAARRAAAVTVRGTRLWIAAERLPELRAIHRDAVLSPAIEPPPSRAVRAWTRADAIVELLRGRLAITGPSIASSVARSLAIDTSDADAALLALESEGAVLRGRFTPPIVSSDAAESVDVTSSGQDRPGPGRVVPGGETEPQEWCDRRLLARIHRYTLNRLRAEIDPVSPADFMRFLFGWQHVAPATHLTGPDGLYEVLTSLDGFELPAGAWERTVLPSRLAAYDPSMLDMLCLAGEIGWARLSTPQPDAPPAARLIAATPIAIYLREHAGAWRTLRFNMEREPEWLERTLPDAARRVLEALRARGASFYSELMAASQLGGDDVREALAVLVAAGLVTSDGYAGVRALAFAAHGGAAAAPRRMNLAGRWSAFGDVAAVGHEAAVQQQAWTLLRRYGVVFRRLLTRETNGAPWREVARVLRRLEARGEIRGGRFVSGMSGEQFALPDAVEQLRACRRSAPDGAIIVLSTADPLNLAGIVTAGDRVRAATRNRIAWRDGIPLAVVEGEFVRDLTPLGAEIAPQVLRALRRRRPAGSLQGLASA